MADAWFSSGGCPGGTFTLYESHRSDAGWSTARILPFSGDFDDQAPAFAPDGRKLYFQTRRSDPAGPQDDDLWRAPVRDTTWGEASPVPAPVRRSPPAISLASRRIEGRPTSGLEARLELPADIPSRSCR